MTSGAETVTMSALNKYKTATIVLLVLVVWLGTALVKAENQRYALSVGLCVSNKQMGTVDYACLEKAQSRTAWYWHIYYGLIN